MNNDLYNETIERRGAVYHYDPDHDCYYRRDGSMTGWERWSPLVVIAVLTVIAIWVEYFR
jgi:hypothetical protein